MYSSTVPDDGGALFHTEHNARASYRREFEEMESRIRRCERQRAELERQFEDLMRERADCERAAVRAVRQRQRRQMEAERQRAERNESILRMLNKIDQQAASLAAKTDRLKMLKTQYEMYLMRTWSTAPQALPAYSVPMITAPPVMQPTLPQSPQKSGFVQYLSELTHQQTANLNPIPPPTALSNYLAAQQKPYASVSNQGAGSVPERPYSRALNAGLQDDLTMMPYGASSARMVAGGSKPNKFEMSNEDFIRYIDSEVLKEPIPKVSIVAPSPVVEVAETKQAGEAYLEDATMSEDEPVGELSNKLKEFSVREEVEAETRNDAFKLSTKDQLQDDPQKLEDVVEKAPEYLASPEMTVPEKEAHSFSEPSLVETFKDDREVIAESSSKISHENQGDFDRDIEELQNHFVQPEMTIPYEVVENKPARDEGSHDLNNTMHQEDIRATNDAMYEASDANVNYLEGTQPIDETVYNPVQSEDPVYDNQQYSTSNVYSEPAPEANVQQHQNPIHQSETRNQHWTTARQAVRSKAFPGVSSKPLTPETDLYEQGGQQDGPPETVTIVPEDISNISQEIVQNAPAQSDSPIAEYPQYSVESNDPYYQTDVSGDTHQAAEQMQTPVSQGYHNDAMGQPVEYQQEEAQQSAAYQYGNSQDGQYMEGTEGASQYQYQEATDPTASSYATQEGYQDPNQQYQQYDENAQYYNDQQGYDAQYYNQVPQQQYYMEESNQQQAGQYEQQMDQPQDQQQQLIQPADQYPAGAESTEQAVYYPPDGQYDPATQNPVQLEAPSSVTASDQPAQVVDDQKPVETSAVIDTPLVKDKQEKKGTVASPPQPAVEQKPSRKEADPGSDAPTLSTVNDESDFDFSTQS